MKIQSILNKLAKCKTRDDVENLHGIISNAFTARSYPATRELSKFTPFFDQAYIENGLPISKSELVRHDTDSLSTFVQIKIQGKKLSVVITATKDGATEREFTEKTVLETNPDQTVSQVAKLAIGHAADNHRRLAERLARC